MQTPKKIASPVILLIASFYLSSCYKKDIEFATNLGETYTNLINVDTVNVNMSTVVLDSFATNGTTSFVAGQYKDPFLGTLSAKPFFQLALPADISLTSDAIYDSLAFILKLNGNYYGDTTKIQTLVVGELDETIGYTYNNQLFNTSNFRTKSPSLGAKTLRISPSKDSVLIRLSDAKGNELFNKLKQSSPEISSSDAFLNYFKGIVLSPGISDSSLIYGFTASPDSIKIRLYYHTSIPYPESNYKDFSYSAANLAFNQLLTDRSGTVLSSLGNGTKEFPSPQTYNQSYMQSIAGVLVKVTFPSLRDILKLSSTVKLLAAKLVVRVAENSFDANKYKLPPTLYLAQTDASNNIGNFISDGAGNILSGTPSTDFIYNTDASYTFDVTSNINTLLTTGGNQANGFYILESHPGSLAPLNRVIINDGNHSDPRTQLILSILTIKNN